MLNTIKLVQRIHDLTDAEMAEKLGVTREYWNGVKNEKYPLTQSLIDTAQRVFPEIPTFFMSTNLTNGKAG